MENITSYLTGEKDRILCELFGLLEIPSISAKVEHVEDMHSAAAYITRLLLEAGADRAAVYPTGGHPVVVAEKIVDRHLPTVMVYGHYDVQPAEPLEYWVSPPFKPEIRDGKIYARGADDDKGQLFMHIKAFEYMCRSGSLPCNAKLMIEGEEEIGSPHLKQFCQSNAAMLACDVILVSDTTMISLDIPSITVGLRGLSYLEVEVTGPNRDLHSGIYGGAVVNPANELARMIASLHDADFRVAVPGFYDDVIDLSAGERELMARAPFDLTRYKSHLNIAEVSGEKGYTTIERTGTRPTLDVNGMWSGYTGEGAKTVLPSKAYAKISARLVPNQQSSVISKLVEAHLKKIASPGVSVQVRVYDGGEAYVSPINSVAYQAASQAIQETFGKTPIPVRSGGSIPIIPGFEEVLGVKTILMGFGLETNAIHSPNEHFPLDNFFKGIETIPRFYHQFARLMQD